MKNVYFSVLLLSALILINSSTSAQLQAFRLGANNFRYSDTLGGTHNVLYFNIMLQHINPDVSGPFNYAAGQYFLNFNPLIANGGVLTYRIVDSDLPASLRPVNPSISGKLLRLAGNIPAPPGSQISTSYPGTKVVRMSLRTSASSFAAVPLNLTLRTPEMSFPVSIAAFNGLFASDVSANGSFYIDSLNNFTNVYLIQPAYNSSGNLSAINFKWNKVNDAAKYTVQVSEDSLMNTLSVNDSLITDTSKTIPGFNLGSRYFWRLKIKDTSGTYYYSYISKFFTKQFLISPADNSTDQNQTVNFIWNNLSDSVVKYILLVSEDSLLNGLIHSDTILADTNRTLSGFQYNSEYFWKVKAVYPGGNDDNAEIRSFKTKLVTIALISPLNNSLNNPTTVSFQWLPPVPDLSSEYYLKISVDSLQNDIFYYDSLSGVTDKTVSGFDLNKKYYWTVSVKDSFNNYVSSQLCNFKTGSLEVYLYSPGNNSTGIPVNPLMIWRKPVINVSNYKLIISKDSLQTDVAFIDSTITDTSKRISGLEFDKKYYWSITAYDTIGNVKMSQVWNFKTSTFLFSPPDNSIVINPLLFQWYRLPLAVSYRLQIASDPLFENIIYADSAITDSVKFISSLPAYWNYYWRISAKNSSGYFRTSEVWTFMIDSPIPVDLLSFTSNVTDNNIKLDWSTASELNNSGFEIERREGRGETQDVWIKIGNVAGNGTTLFGQSYTYTDRNLTSGNYNYRLKQIDFNGNFEYFNLTNEIGIGIPVKYDLSQNYPNPFNPSTSINYDLPVDGKVSLKIFDMTGREVTTLVNEVQTAGYYSINYNASTLSSGVYFYTISANNFVQTKKMMLVK